jgi:hypothetical protein
MEHLFFIIVIILLVVGARGSLVVKALGYKPEDRGFETQWGDILHLPNPSGRTRPWGLLSLWQKRVLETLKEMFLGSKFLPVCGPHNLTAIYDPIV